MAKKGRSFLASTIIIFIFALAVFYIGWTQIKIRPNHIGVVVSKTGGVSPKVAESGTFSWYWEFLLPTNAELRLYSVLPYHFTRKITGELPSAETYRAFSSFRPDFSYSADVSITVEISKKGIYELCKKNAISDQASLDHYMEKMADFLTEEALKTLNAHYSDDAKPSQTPFYLDSRTVFSNSDFYTQKDFSEIEITEFSITNQHMPDADLYRAAKKSAVTFFSSQNFNSQNYNSQPFGLQNNENQSQNQEYQADLPFNLFSNDEKKSGLGNLSNAGSISSASFDKKTDSEKTQSTKSDDKKADSKSFSESELTEEEKTAFRQFLKMFRNYSDTEKE